MIFASETGKRWKKGYVSGSFDMFHIGHLNLIRRAKERCDYLVAGVLTDENIANYKKKWPVIPLKDRMEIVGALKYVDEVDATTEPLINKIAAWEKYGFDAMFSGDDHARDGWAWEDEELKKRGADLVFFPYTKEVSTAMLQELTLPPKAKDADAPRRLECFTYLFPFGKVSKGERVVLYGTGNVAAQYAAQLAAISYCDVAAFADTYAEPGASFEGKRCLTPDELLLKMDSFDRIVVASAKHYDQIIGRLRALGIRPERIV